jgi:uncharacterized protein DUF1592/uncharacterized protein DUF1588/uncharacterized protein DUF1595
MRQQSWRRSILLPALFATAIGAAGMAGGCSGEDDVEFPSGGSTGSGGSQNDPAFNPAPGGVRRLLSHQYINSVRYLLGNAAADAVAAADLLPPDQAVQGYLAIGAAETPPSLNYPELWDLSADTAAQAAVADPSRLAEWVPCVTTMQDDTCYEEFAETFGRLVFRRPIIADEKTWIVDLAKAARDKFDFMQGIRYALRGMLQYPSFIYLEEVGETVADAVTPRRQLNGYELASRMAFFLTDTTPDEELLDSVDPAGVGLGSLDDIRAQAQRLLEKPEAKATVERRLTEFLYIDAVLSAQKSPDWYPQFSDLVRGAMVEEAQRLITDVVWTRDGDVRDIFTADYTFVNDVLAPIYGFTPPAPGQWKKVSWPEEENRAGYLSMGAFLARASHSVTTSPTRRGTFIKDRILCEAVPPPDPSVNPVLPQPQPGDVPKTAKELLAAHTTNPTCKACHAQFDPYGIGLEHYDAIGAYRDTDAGQDVDSTGEVDGFGAFESARDIAAILLSDESQRVSKCIILNYFRGSLGHLETEGEQPALDELHTAFAGGGFKLQQLLVEMTVNPAFLNVAELEP